MFQELSYEQLRLKFASSPPHVLWVLSPLKKTLLALFTGFRFGISRIPSKTITLYFVLAVLDGFIDIINPESTVLSSAIHKSQQHSEKNTWECKDLNPGHPGEKQVCYLCAMQPPRKL